MGVVHMCDGQLSSFDESQLDSVHTQHCDVCCGQMLT